MVRDGLVTREPDPDDRRATRIALSARGAALRDELVPLAMAVNEATLSCLNGPEQTAFTKLLHRLVNA
jgi:DNA-binding MarR family transcriptional regulator